MTMLRTSKQKKIKRVPQRTCIACRKIQDKQTLIRIVNTPEGGIEIDTGSKMSGRGAYLCKNIGCWEEGLKGKRLEHALKTDISQEIKNRLLDRIKEYLGEI
jgi:predicted RNA-binding protein YlxR (DUF448 family)